MQEIPRQSAEVFEILNKGQFICSNSSKEPVRKLHSAISQDYDSYYDYFIGINMILEKGDDEYYYFARAEGRAEMERKLEIAMKWIDIVDFLKTFENSFGSGFRFKPYNLLVRLSVDADLKNKLEGLKKYTPGKEKYAEIIEKILDILEKDNFIELENNIVQEYKTLASFTYLEKLILAIDIPEDIKHEIPE